MKGKAIKILGLVVTVLGAVTSIASSWVDEKKMEEKIDEKFNEYLANQTSETTEES